MLQVFSLKDEKAKLFHPPFYSSSAVQAARSVIQAAQDTTTNLAKFSSEFALYLLGDFNEETGFIHPQDPVKLATVEALLEGKGL